MSEGMIKILDYSSLAGNGQRTIQIADNRFKDSMMKTAGAAAWSPKICEILGDLPKDSNKITVVINAMGAGEYYGCNANYDWFSEDALKQYHPTFVSHGKPFLHHVNHDKAKSYGKISDSDYNDRMHRVELIVGYDTDSLDKKYVDRLNNDELVNVSMGCRIPADYCLIKGTLIRTQNGHIPIENVSVGDIVHTHTGAYKAVTQLFNRKCSDLVTVSSSGVLPITGSANHSIFILKKEDVRACRGSSNGKKRRHTYLEGRCVFCNKQITYAPQWVELKDVSVGDYVLSPVDFFENGGVGVDRARLLGYYVGDGNIISQGSHKDKQGPKKDMGFAITASEGNVEHVRRVLETISKCSLRNPARVYSYKKGVQTQNALRIGVYDRDFSSWLQEFGGRGSWGKRLSSEVINWPTVDKLAFLGGYIDTDGCFDEKGSIRICTVNRGLALDTQRLLHSLQVPASVSNAGVGYYVYIPPSFSNIFIGHSLKVKGYTTQWHASTSFFWENYWCAPVKSINRTQEDTPVTVYNFSVEGDESYIAEGIVVHNCSICNNRAKTPANYCEHLKLPPSKRWLPDGRKAFAINPDPTFFDISIVTIPADPTARVMFKVGSNKTYFDMNKTSCERAREEFKMEDRRTCKTAETLSIKTVDDPVILNGAPAPDVSPIVEQLLKGFDRALGMDIPTKTLNDIGALSNDPMSILKSFIDKGTYLRPKETQRIICVSSGNPELADKLDSMGVLSRSPFPMSLIDELMNSTANQSVHEVLPASFSSDREMTHDNAKKIVIKIMISPMCKDAGLQPVEVSDDFKHLNREEVESKYPGFFAAAGNALKTYTALGALASAFDAIFGARLSNKFLGSAAAYPLLAGGMLGTMLEDTSNMLNAPSQEMQYQSARDLPGLTEMYATANGNPTHNMANAAREIGNSKIASSKRANIVDFGLKPLLSIPMAYAASELISRRAKQYDMDEYQRTGNYEPSTLANPSASMLMALPLVLKFAESRQLVEDYIKTAETKLNSSFSKIYAGSPNSVLKNIHNLLFKNA